MFTAFDERCPAATTALLEMQHAGEGAEPLLIPICYEQLNDEGRRHMLKLLANIR